MKMHLSPASNIVFYIYLMFIFIGIIYKLYGRLILHHSFYRKIDSQWRRLFSKWYIEEIARNSKHETMREGVEAQLSQRLY